jgi:hypothetical protein
MKYFRYSIIDDEVKAFTGEIQSIPPEFIQIKSDFWGDSIYYKIEDVQITEVIGEALTEPAARRRVEEFVSALNVNVF